jgi:DNA replication protein DnaC
MQAASILVILTSNHGFAAWREVFSNPVVATAPLDRLLDHAIVVLTFRLDPGPG